MAKVIDFLRKAGNSYNVHKGEYGLEIETEAGDVYKIPSFAFWDTKNDGSLRGFGIEYVLKNPLKFEREIPEALAEFKDKTKDIKFIKDSITTSVHVHINMLNEDMRTLVNFFTTYTLVENLLVRYSGEARRSNGFALPICDAEEVYVTMRDMLYGLEDKFYNSLLVPEELAKYGGLNLASLSRFGSLEVRLFRGETDTSKIYKWISIVNKILSYSRTPGMYPPDIIVQFKQKGVGILKDIFQEDYKEVYHLDEQKLIEDNFLLAGNLAYTIKDWSKLEASVKPKVNKPEKVDKLAMKHFNVPQFVELNALQQREIMNAMNQMNAQRENQRRIRPFDLPPREVGGWEGPEEMGINQGNDAAAERLVDDPDF